MASAKIRQCEFCGRELTMRPGEIQDNFRHRKSCGPVCSGKLRAISCARTRERIKNSPPERREPIRWENFLPEPPDLPLVEMPREELERIAQPHRGVPAVSYAAWGRV